MAEFRRLPTQTELQQMLFMEQMRTKTPQEIAQENLAKGTTITPIPENVFQKMAGGARTAKEFVNRAGTAADVAKLFPGYTGQSTVNIPTSFNFAPKQAPTGEVIPGGLQTQPINVNQLLSAIKPADVLGISGAEKAYTDVGLGKAPQPLDVLDVAGLGAIGYGAGKTALKATRGLPVGMSIQEAKGLLQTAPRSDLGFYSAVEETALNLPRKQGSGQAFLNDLMKGSNVQKDEIRWMGLDDYLKDKPNVTRQEVQDFIANNRVDVQEVRFGGAEPFDAKRLSQLESEYKALKNHPIDDPSFGENKYDEMIRLMNIRDQSTTQSLYDAADRAINSAQRAQRQGNRIAAEKYFREAEFLNTRAEKLDLEGQGMSNPPQYEKYQLPGGKNYREIVLTMPSDSLNTNQIATKLFGKEMRFLTESEKDRVVQESRRLFENRIDYRSTHFPDISNPLAHIRVNDRIDADGKKMLLIEEVQSDWHQAGREHGYKSGKNELPEGWTVNEDPAKNGMWIVRNNSGEMVSTGLGEVDAIRSALGSKGGVPDAPFKDTWYQLALKRAIKYAADNGYDRIGLTTAERQIKRYPDEKNVKGMKKYYDEIYPRYLDKYGKKWGARVGETNVNTVMERAENSMIPTMGQEPVRYLDITPEMKQSVSKGQPLFMAAPAGAGLLGSQQERK